MLIRDAVDADADAVATIHHRGWVETYRGLLPDPYLDALTLEACLARWRAGMTGANRTYVATASDQVVGFATVGRSADGDAPAAGELWDLWVLPEHRSAGVGARLLHHALARLAVDHRVAVVWVLAGNTRARAFYERQGALRDGLTREQQVPGGVMTDVRYLFDLRGRAERAE